MKIVGPVLLDFPYVYKLDGDKLFCNAPSTNSISGCCEGIIDYDPGYNFLYCTKCGVKYKAKELAQAIETNNVIVKSKGDIKMKIVISGGTNNAQKEIVTGEFSNMAKSLPRKKQVSNSTNKKENSNTKEKTVNGVIESEEKISTVINDQETADRLADFIKNEEIINNKKIVTPVEFDESIIKATDEVIEHINEDADPEELFLQYMSKVLDIVDKVSEDSKNVFLETVFGPQISEAIAIEIARANKKHENELNKVSAAEAKAKDAAKKSKDKIKELTQNLKDAKNRIKDLENQIKEFEKDKEALKTVHEDTDKNQDADEDNFEQSADRAIFSATAFINDAAEKDKEKCSKLIDNFIDYLTQESADKLIESLITNYYSIGYSIDGVEYSEDAIKNSANPKDAKGIFINFAQKITREGYDGTVDIYTEKDLRSIVVSINDLDVILQNDGDLVIVPKKEFREFVDYIKNKSTNKISSTESDKYGKFKFFAATIINPKEIISTQQSSKAIVILDENGNYLTIGDNNDIIAINILQDKFVESLSIVSSSWLSGMQKQIAGQEANTEIEVVAEETEE